MRDRTEGGLRPDVRRLENCLCGARQGGSRGCGDHEGDRGRSEVQSGRGTEGSSAESDDEHAAGKPRCSEERREETQGGIKQDAG